MQIRNCSKYHIEEYISKRWVIQVSDELLADVDAAKARAMEAISLAESTLTEAQHTLEILDGTLYFKYKLSNTNLNTNY